MRPDVAVSSLCKRPASTSFLPNTCSAKVLVLQNSVRAEVSPFFSGAVGMPCFLLRIAKSSFSNTIVKDLKHSIIFYLFFLALFLHLFLLLVRMDDRIHDE